MCVRVDACMDGVANVCVHLGVQGVGLLRSERAHVECMDGVAHVCLHE